MTGLIDLWATPWDEIAALQIFPNCRMDDDEWIIAERETSGGSLRRLSARRIGFLDALPAEWDRTDPRAIHVVRRLKRMAALIRVTTARFKRRNVNPPKSSTWVLNCQALVRAARRSLVLPRERPDGPSECPDDTSIFAHLTPQQLANISASERTFASAVIPRLNAFVAAGKFDDWPAADVASDRLGDEPWQPFDDAFTAELARAALWYCETFGLDIVRCHDELAAMTILPSGSRRRTDLNEWRKERLRGWSGGKLRPGAELAYEIVTGSTKSGKAAEMLSAWPPKLPRQVKRLVLLLQGAHAIIGFLSTAMRDGEMAELGRDCLEEVKDGPNLVGLTFKMSDNPKGEMRRWPLPNVAVEAIQRQAALANVLEPRGRSLWVPLSPLREGEGLASLSSHVVAFCASIRKGGKSLGGMCEGRPHPHRFRKTVARLAGLALQGAGQILFDVLGHRDPEMTLAYMLSDPDLQDEIRAISREALVALGREAITTADSNGGPAAAAVRALADRIVPRRGEQELGADDVASAAEILAVGGSLALVRPGVLCTKAFNQFGPCSRKAGNPDVGSCQVDCTHRLELAAARSDAIRCIEQILEMLPAATGATRAWWSGQLKTQLARFDDVRARYEDDPRIGAALQHG